MAHAEDIEKIDMLKGSAATTGYGDKGKNGVVLITTKKHQLEVRATGIATTDPVELILENELLVSCANLE
jgi:TonB-dependent SusC/RagA subfamily outer membrane receptor